jgi:hypothetical protein
VQNVKEEIKSIAFKSNNNSNQNEEELNKLKAIENPLKLPDEFSGLISEFNLFSQTLSQINSNSNNYGMRYFLFFLFVFYSIVYL